MFVCTTPLYFDGFLITVTDTPRGAALIVSTRRRMPWIIVCGASLGVSSALEGVERVGGGVGAAHAVCTRSGRGGRRAMYIPGIPSRYGFRVVRGRRPTGGCPWRR